MSSTRPDSLVSLTCGACVSKCSEPLPWISCKSHSDALGARTERLTLKNDAPFIRSFDAIEIGVRTAFAHTDRRAGKLSSRRAAVERAGSVDSAIVVARGSHRT